MLRKREKLLFPGKEVFPFSRTLIPFQEKRGILPLRCRGITNFNTNVVIGKILSPRSGNRVFQKKLACFAAPAGRSKVTISKKRRFSAGGTIRYFCVALSAGRKTAKNFLRGDAPTKKVHLRCISLHAYHSVHTNTMQKCTIYANAVYGTKCFCMDEG